MAKQKHVLNVVTRTETGKGPVKRLRKAGQVPAVIYHAGAAAKTIYFNAAEWEALQKYELNLLLLKEGETEHLALIKEVQNDFIRGKVKHIDFLEVDRSKKIKAVVAVKAGHTAPAGLSQGGMLEQFVHEIEVECLPDALPEAIEADVSALAMGQSLHIGDIVMPEGVAATGDKTIVVFSVIDPAKAALEAEAAEGEGAAEPEVIGEKERAEKAAAKAAKK
ncbi:MAG: 50S ribosomal protein L25 [Lentisphaeria bacterium]|nr:50S ribosomal protein L25 [Lentisphaeria bacterium]